MPASVAPSRSEPAPSEEGDARFAAQQLAGELAMPFVDLRGVAPPAEVLQLVPRTVAAAQLVFPLRRTDRTLEVAVADPLAHEVLDRLTRRIGLAVVPSLALRDDIVAAVQRNYEGEAPAERVDATVAGGDPNDGPVIALVQTIIADAVAAGASDIHLEPLELRLRVRFRVDGELQEAGAPDRQWHLAIVSRLKIMANLSIAEKRVPQDGRLHVAIAGRSLDLRVATLPTVHGESVVMRILDRERLRTDLGELGLTAEQRSEFERFLAASDGMALVTGPTGSGKTTTLYSCLAQLNRPDRKLITVEDPIEYQLEGVNQVPVNVATGMTFAAALRALLRQSPNVVMVGEIRDLETAQIAVNASLTGHLVFSTLHTNDAPSAITRLIDLGVKPSLLAAALRTIVAQRLVRRLCRECRIVRPVPEAARTILAAGGDRLPAELVACGTGCPACRGSGYRGRVGLFEILPINAEIRAGIYDNITAVRLRGLARRAGMRTMREDGIRKVLAGVTTIEEVVSATAGDLVLPAPNPSPA